MKERVKSGDPIRKVNRIHQRICNCGECKTCRLRIAKAKYYLKNRDRIRREVNAKRHQSLGPDLDEQKLNEYFEKVRDKEYDDRYMVVRQNKENKTGQQRI